MQVVCLDCYYQSNLTLQDTITFAFVKMISRNLTIFITLSPQQTGLACGYFGLKGLNVQDTVLDIFVLYMLIAFIIYMFSIRLISLIFTAIPETQLIYIGLHPTHCCRTFIILYNDIICTRVSTLYQEMNQSTSNS